jgi:hypothetical protein
MKRAVTILLFLVAIGAVRNALIHSDRTTSANSSEPPRAATPISASPPEDKSNPFSDGAWQSDRNGATDAGVCDLSGGIMLVQGRTWGLCLHGLACEETELDASTLNLTQIAQNEFWETIPAYGVPFVRYRVQSNVQRTSVKYVESEIISPDTAVRKFGSVAKAEELYNGIVGMIDYKCTNVPNMLPRLR